ncbi:MAG: YidB family protein, partial [Gammaproteobacteria bacterium]
SLDAGALREALAGLLGGDGGQVDIGAILGKLQGGGLAGLASSWLGDGANASLAPAQVLEMFGVDKVETFAATAGIDGARAGKTLAAMLPELVDRCSSGGQLLEAVGGAGGLLGAATRLFR